MKGTFWMLFAIYFVVLALGTLALFALHTAKTYGVPFQYSLDIVTRVIIDAALYKKIMILSFLLAAAFLGTRYSLYGKL
ncbi:MAG TPA: hypothetical protein VD967_00960 [Candidatus Paceibacterota bacterium]|nr:hypothetical protein [Candidatus Paceibacterota bacterium]